jgi:predicted DNA-binding transcriptional regulator AlpA
MKRETFPLPPTLAPRGLTREEAAAYLGIGTTLFDDLVKSGLLPAPHKLHGAVRWDRLEVDDAFEKMPRNGQGPAAEANDDPWGHVRA